MAFKLYLRHRLQNLIWLCLDPGLKNFAYAVVKQGKILEAGFIKHTVEKNDREYRDSFEKEITTLIKRIKPDIVTAERFMTRSFLAAMAETVGVMVGMIYVICRSNDIEFVTITAASWKLSIKKIMDLKQLYKDAKKQCKLPPHPLDCLCMQRYVMNKFQFYPKDKIWLYKNIKNCAKQLVV